MTTTVLLCTPPLSTSLLFCRHTISSGIWNTFNLIHQNGSESFGVTISQAIHNWLSASKRGETVHYQDNCNGIHCNRQCPDIVILGELHSYWGVGAQVAITTAILSITLICVSLKVALSVYAHKIKWEQMSYEEFSKHKALDQKAVVSQVCGVC